MNNTLLACRYVSYRIVKLDSVFESAIQHHYNIKRTNDICIGDICIGCIWNICKQSSRKIWTIQFEKWCQMLFETNVKSNFRLLFKCVEYWDWTKWTQSVPHSIFKPAHQFSGGEFVQFSGKSLQQMYVTVKFTRHNHYNWSVCIRNESQLNKLKSHANTIDSQTFESIFFTEKWLIIVLETGVWSKVIRAYSPNWSKNLVNE